MRKIYLITLLLLLNSCDEAINEKTIIDLDKENTVSIFDLVDSISVIQLETKKESLLKSGYVLSHKNRFYVFDGSQQILFCFDKNGKYLFKIDKRGNGPDEYSYASNFKIDRFNDYLMFIMAWGTLVCYDLDGNFISKTKLPNETSSYNNIIAINKDTLLSYTWTHNYKSGYYSKSKDKILKWVLPTTLEFVGAFPPGNSYFYKDSLFFYNAGLNNEIINMTDTNQKISYKYDFGKNNYTEKQIHSLLEFMEKKRAERKNVITRKEILGDSNYPKYFIYECLETDRFRILFLNYKKWGEHLYLFQEKSSGKNNLFRKTIEGIFFDRYNLSNAIIITKPNKNFEPLQKVLNQEQLKIISNHNPDNDNPFLVIYHLK